MHTRALLPALVLAAIAPVVAQQPSTAPAAPATPAAAQPAAPPPTPKPGVPGVQHPMARIVPDAEYPIVGGPDWLAMGEGQVWTNSRAQNLVSRMDPDTGETVAMVPVGAPCSGLVVAAGTLWAPSCSEKVLYRIDTVTNQVVAKVPVAPANNEGGIAFGAGSVWLPSDPAGEISRIEPATNGVSARIRIAPGSYTAVFGYGRVWVSSTDKSLVTVIHPASNRIIAEIPVDANPRFMAVGEGFVWTLNQKRGTVSKIDPFTLRTVATIEVGVPGTGGDIAAGEGAVWVTARDVPVSRIDPVANKVTHQFRGPGGDAIRVLHGSVWLSNGRWSNVWRFQASKILTLEPLTWTVTALPLDLDADGTPDVLVEDVPVWFPGKPVTIHAKPLTAKASGGLVLKAWLNKKKVETSFGRSGDALAATVTFGEPRWIHYAVCAGAKCTPELVIASPTTHPDFAAGTARFAPETFVAPGPPQLAGYVWNILEPEILKPDYQALLDRDGRPANASGGTLAEDYGELKRHRWEFQHHTAFAYGVLTPDRQEEQACVYINPSPKAGYDATVRLWVTKQGAAAGLEPKLEKAVRAWIAARWPFKKVAFPGRDMPMSEWNALPDARPAAGKS
ncbi:MAG: hypothetical protein AB7I25_02795 [Vicinamibacterales bacterium]